MNQPLTKDRWASKFAHVLTTDLRPDVGLKFAYAVALSEWSAHHDMDPGEAAKLWAKERAAAAEKKPDGKHP